MKKGVLVTRPINPSIGYGDGYADPEKLVGSTRVGRIQLKLFAGTADLKGRDIELVLNQEQVKSLIRDLMDLDNRMSQGLS